MPSSTRDRPLGALLKALVTMDLRGQHYGRATGVRAGALVSPLLWVLAQFLTASCLLSAFLFARVHVEFFAFAGLATSMMLVFSAIVVEFHEVVLDPRDREILGHRPIPPRTYALARMGNLLFYVALMSVALTIFPAILGAALRDAGPGYLPAYLYASFLLNLFTAAVVVLFYTLFARSGAFEGAKTVLAWTQILLIMVLFYGAQMMLRKATGDFELFAARPPQWFGTLPPMWLASFVSGRFGWWFAVAATAVVAATCALAVARLSHAYAAVHSGGARTVTLPVPVRKRRLGPAALAFRLTRTMMRRDADLKMRTWPSLGMGVAAVGLGLFSGQWTDPMRVTGATSILPLAVIPLLASAVPIAIHNLAYSRDHRAAWLLHAAPLASPARFRDGVRSAVLYTFFLPVMALFFLVLCWTWGDPLHALAHVGIGWLVIEGVARISFVVALPGHPFSRPLSRGATMGGIGVVSAFVVGGAGFLSFIHLHAARHPLALAVYACALFWTVVVLHRWSARHA